jgi:cytochrome c peroxidase
MRVNGLLAAMSATLSLAGAALAQNLGPAPEFVEPDMARAELGRQLFYDPILSGNRNISCATCHHPRLGTADGVSLALGEGARGLGPARVGGGDNAPDRRIPRNAPALWNLGAKEFQRFFHDGRLEEDPNQPSGFRTPLGEEMVAGFDSALAAQAMFPVLSPEEMAGHYSENDVSRAVNLGLITYEGGAWDMIAARVAAIPEYASAFAAVAPGKAIDFPLIANVIADFIRFEWRADDSPFDRYMRDGTALSGPAARGMELFYGNGACSGCHSGWFQTDHSFHAIAMPQIGPGKAARFENHARDEGRARVSGDQPYAFRTPSLRNVTLTAPYGHGGTYATLKAVIRHHLDPVTSLMSYDPEQAILPDLPGTDDLRVMHDAEELQSIAAANELKPMSLSEGEIDDITAFLGALEDRAERLGVPHTVPSGLPVDR